MDFAHPHFAEPRWLWLAVLAPVLLVLLQRGDLAVADGELLALDEGEASALRSSANERSLPETSRKSGTRETPKSSRAPSPWRTLR